MLGSATDLDLIMGPTARPVRCPDLEEEGSVLVMVRGRKMVVAGLLAVVAAVGSGCGSGSGSGASAPSATEAGPTTTAAEPVESTPVAGTAGGIDPSLTREDVDCSEEALQAGDDSISFWDAYYVVGGTLGALCFGDEDPTVTQAWKELAVITPPEQLNDLALFAGFTSPEGEDEASGTTMAFVNVIDDEGTAFQMSVNLDAYDEDPQEAKLTMAHEFSHVFTATASQIDRSAEAVETCETYFNGEGCYTDDALMAEWIQRFWTDDELDQIDPQADASLDDGATRCRVNPGFLGDYAASTPEEDFAETFSAYVYDVPAPTPEVQAKYDWLAQQPGLAEFHERAVAAGAGPLEGSFEGCGS